MKRIWGIALLVGIGLLSAGGSQAKTIPHHRVKCRKGYARRTIWVPQRRHGRIVRTLGMIVYTRVQRCVKVTKPKAPSPPGVVTTTTTTATPLPPPFAPIGSPPTFPPPLPPPAASAPTNIALPTISGSATQGNTLSASTGTWSNAPTSYIYQWQRCDPAGSACSATGVTASTYAVTNADVGSTMRVSVTAGNDAGSASATSAATRAVASGTSPGDPVVVAAGDIARPPSCASSCEQSVTAALAQSFNPNSVFVLGDNQYDSGLYSEYTGSYDLSWGQDFNPIVNPVPGNHEYAASSSAVGYFQYFGAAAHPSGGYYSFNLGTWHIVALNSDCSNSGCADDVNGTTSSTQTAWLQSDLAANRSQCVLAMWHHPLFSSGWTLGSSGVGPLWMALYNARADVVLNGHDHLYERYAQLDPTGTPTTDGIREFVVGTGGESLNGISSSKPPLPYPQADDRSYGVLVLTLHATSYSWKFVTTSGATVDSGTTACHALGAATGGAAARDSSAAPAARLAGPQLSFDARAVNVSLNTVTRDGLPVAVHCSRACDVTVTAWLQHGRRLQRIASFYETESQIPGPYSRIVLKLPARRLAGLRVARLVLRFAAVDAAGHHRAQTTTVSLGSR